MLSTSSAVSVPTLVIAVCAGPVTVAAVPEQFPVTLPSKFATKVPVSISKSPESPPVKVPVPTLNLSSLSSQPIKALSAVPLSITIPLSLTGASVVPFPSSIRVSWITELVVESVVVVPLTIKLPPTVKFLLIFNPVASVPSSSVVIETVPLFLIKFNLLFNILISSVSPDIFIIIKIKNLKYKRD